MPRNFKNQLAGQIGEATVVAELGRRGFVATAFSGNVPDIDLLAYKQGKTISIQVKAWRKGSVSFDAKRFLNISWEGKKQVVSGKQKGLDKLPLYFFVKISEHYGGDRFFILDQWEVAETIREGYQSFLDKHNGIRPKNHLTTHNSVTLQQLRPYEDRWERLEEAFANFPK